MDSEGDALAALSTSAVESAYNSLRLACEVHTTTLDQQRQALPASASCAVGETMATVRARVDALKQQLSTELEADWRDESDGAYTNWMASAAHARPADGGMAAVAVTAGGVAPTPTLASSNVDACVGLSAAREARMAEAEATLRTCEKRLEALRSTRSDAATSLSHPSLATGTGGTEKAGSAVAAERALKELDSTAAFELEQVQLVGR